MPLQVANLTSSIGGFGLTDACNDHYLDYDAIVDGYSLENGWTTGVVTIEASRNGEKQELFRDGVMVLRIINIPSSPADPAHSDAPKFWPLCCSPAAKTLHIAIHQLQAIGNGGWQGQRVDGRK